MFQGGTLAEDRLAREGPAFGQDRCQVDTGTAVRDRKPCRAAERGEKVDQADQIVSLKARPVAARPCDNQRHLGRRVKKQRFLPGALFAGHLAVVRRVDHQGLLGQAQVIQDPEDAPDGIVDPFDTGTIGGQGAQGDRLVPVVALRTAVDRHRAAYERDRLLVEVMFR